MAQIHTYTVGTPAATDRIPYISDPAGTPALKLAAVSALSTGGTTWTQVANIAGTSTAGFNSYNGGTWTSDGASIGVTNAGGGSYFYGTTPIDVGFSIVESEVQLLAAGGDIYGGIGFMLANGSGAPTHGDAPYCRLQRAGGAWSVLGGRPNVDRISVPFAGATDTWFRLRVLMAGGTVSVALDGTPIIRAYGTGEYRADSFALWSYNSAVRWRNIKVWTADLGAWTLT